MEPKLNKKGEKFISDMVYREIILKYLFVKEKMDENYGLQYISNLYKINAESTITLYNNLDPKRRNEIEEDIKGKIESGEISLNDEAVRWHREGLKHDRRSEMDNERDEGR